MQKLSLEGRHEEAIEAVPDDLADGLSLSARSGASGNGRSRGARRR